MRARHTGVLFGAALGIPAALAGGWHLATHASTPPILGPDGLPVPGSLATLEHVRLGGTEQCLLIRGRDTRSPVLLFLSGGPGGSEMAWVRHFNAGLEDHFLVVNWDQRGAAKSFGACPRSSLTVEQYVSDTIELAELLRRRFAGPRVLVGHSWGSVLGVLALQRRPDLFAAYVGIGQQVNSVENDRITWQCAVEDARAHDEGVALERLLEAGPPPYTGPELAERYATMVSVVNGCRSRPGLLREMLAVVRRAPEYSALDRLRFLRGLKESFEVVYPQLAHLDLVEGAPKLDRPVYLMLGRHDVVTPSSIAERWFDRLEAPHKELFWFEHSGHAPNFEEPAAFEAAMIERVLARLEA